MKKLKSDTKDVTENSDESDDDMQNDFFSFNKPIELPEPMELPLELPNKAQSSEPKMSKLESYFKKDVIEEPVELQPDDESHSEYADSEAGSSYSNGTEAETANNTEMVLDDEAVSIYSDFVYKLFNFMQLPAKLQYLGNLLHNINLIYLFRSRSYVDLVANVEEKKSK